MYCPGPARPSRWSTGSISSESLDSTALISICRTLFQSGRCRSSNARLDERERQVIRNVERQRGCASRRIEQGFDPRRKSLRRPLEHQQTVAAANFPNERACGACEPSHSYKIVVVRHHKIRIPFLPTSVQFLVGGRPILHAVLRRIRGESRASCRCAKWNRGPLGDL